jgi:hypothetical protein
MDWNNPETVLKELSVQIDYVRPAKAIAYFRVGAYSLILSLTKPREGEQRPEPFARQLKVLRAMADAAGLDLVDTSRLHAPVGDSLGRPEERAIFAAERMAVDVAHALLVEAFGDIGIE